MPISSNVTFSGVVSSTITVSVIVKELPAASVTVYVTVYSPMAGAVLSMRDASTVTPSSVSDSSTIFRISPIWYISPSTSSRVVEKLAE